MACMTHNIDLKEDASAMEKRLEDGSAARSLEHRTVWPSTRTAGCSPDAGC